MALIQATHAYNIIYVYCADDADHQGIVKIGKATVRTEPQKFEQMVPNCEALVRAANERIHEQTGTFGASPRLLHTELAHFKSETGAELQFYDTDVHQVLLNSGYTRHRFPKLADKQHKSGSTLHPSSPLHPRCAPSARQPRKHAPRCVACSTSSPCAYR